MVGSAVGRAREATRLFTLFVLFSLSHQKEDVGCGAACSCALAMGFTKKGDYACPPPPSPPSEPSPPPAVSLSGVLAAPWGVEGFTKWIVEVKSTPVTGTLSAYKAACESIGATPAASNSYPGCGGDAYSYLSTTYNCGTQARALWTSTLKALGATADNLLVMHGTSPNCFANNANTGSMLAFSDVESPSSSGFSYCRGGDTAAKTHHLFLCIA